LRKQKQEKYDAETATADGDDDDGAIDGAKSKKKNKIAGVFYSDSIKRKRQSLRKEVASGGISLDVAAGIRTRTQIDVVNVNDSSNELRNGKNGTDDDVSSDKDAIKSAAVVAAAAKSRATTTEDQNSSDNDGISPEAIPSFHQLVIDNDKNGNIEVHSGTEPPGASLSKQRHHDADAEHQQQKDLSIKDLDGTTETVQDEKDNNDDDPVVAADDVENESNHDDLTYLNPDPLLSSSPASGSHSPTGERVRRHLRMYDNKTANIMSRDVQIAGDFHVRVWEWEKPAAVVETYWQVENQGLSIHDQFSSSSSTATKKPMLDPFGLITWPGSVVAVHEMMRHSEEAVRNKTVLVVGAGVGVEAQAAAVLGAAKVHATDIHPTTQRLLRYGAEQAGLNDTISTGYFDLFSPDPLPECDLLVAADVLYNDRLGAQVAQRCVEAYQRNATVLISDSQRFCGKFQDDINEQMLAVDPNRKRVVWHGRRLPAFTGSGVLVDVDQTYECKARIMWINL